MEGCARGCADNMTAVLNSGNGISVVYRTCVTPYLVRTPIHNGNP